MKNQKYSRPVEVLTKTVIINGHHENTVATESISAVPFSFFKKKIIIIDPRCLQFHDKLL